jgi:SAM-dependent MidA family methyltransferase
MENFIFDLLNKRPDQQMSIRDYMEAVLYDPVHGYYMRSNEKVGKKGDFYTSSNLADMFGRILGRWFISTIQQLSVEPIICELGAGTGKVAKSILLLIREEYPDIYQNTKYYIVEKSPYHQTLLKKEFLDFQNVRVFRHLDELPSIDGIMFSNELFDAFPIHVIEMKDGNLYEIFVNAQKGKLTEVYQPLTNENICSFIRQQNINLNEGQRFEVPLDMVKYLEKLTPLIGKGMLVTIDYGYTNEEWMERIHQKGSLRGFYRHQMIEDILLYPGRMDITSHIHFDALDYYGSNLGLKKEGLLLQDEFLIKAGILNDLIEHNGQDPFSESSRRNRAILSLISSGGISPHFRVLFQSKGVHTDFRLFEK